MALSISLEFVEAVPSSQADWIDPPPTLVTVLTHLWASLLTNNKEFKKSAASYDGPVGAMSHRS